jgi:nitroimidazol reductase NimA-like FMN-containing flavoprotein (pyridoxamine 5'-phosphate oxidase superfamily)
MKSTGKHDGAPAAGFAASGRAGSRTHIRRHPERAAPEIAEDILRAGRVAHVAFALDGQPFVLPFTYHYEGGKLYLHGAPASRAISALRAGTPVCAEVTLLDGLVASRMAKYHSMNYRCVVVFGRAVAVSDDEERRAIFERMTARYFPGRTAGADYAPAREGDLRGTQLLAIEIEELSAKSRTGPPMGPTDAEAEAPGSRFVVLLPGLDT